MEHAGSLLVAIAAELLRQAPAAEAPVLAWPVVCGPVVSGRTRAVLFANGTLRVEVPDVGWRTELAALEPRYVREFERLLGSDRVQRVEFLTPSPKF